MKEVDSSHINPGGATPQISYWDRVQRRTIQLGEALGFLKLELDRIKSIVTRLEKDVRALERHPPSKDSE